jgi:hypothetical protein
VVVGGHIGCLALQTDTGCREIRFFQSARKLKAPPANYDEILPPAPCKKGGAPLIGVCPATSLTDFYPFGKAPSSIVYSSQGDYLEEVVCRIAQE